MESLNPCPRQHLAPNEKRRLALTGSSRCTGSPQKRPPNSLAGKPLRTPRATLGNSWSPGACLENHRNAQNIRRAIRANTLEAALTTCEHTTRDAGWARTHQGEGAGGALGPKPARREASFGRRTDRSRSEARTAAVRSFCSIAQGRRRDPRPAAVARRRPVKDGRTVRANHLRRRAGGLRSLGESGYDNRRSVRRERMDAVRLDWSVRRIGGLRKAVRYQQPASSDVTPSELETES
jgi:hypothetical protein